MWQLEYGLNTAFIAAAYFWFSGNVLFNLIARHDPLVTYLGNAVTIVALLALNEWAIRFSHRPNRRPRKGLWKWLIWALASDEDLVCFKTALYFFYLAALVVGRVAAYDSAWRVSDRVHEYLDIMSVTFVLLVALDKLVDEYVKSSKRARRLIEHTKELDTASS